MARQRRHKGEGSYVERKDGTWQFSITVGRDETGQRQRVYVSAPTRAALVRKVQDERARNGGTFQPPVPETVAGLVTTFLAEKRDSVSASTNAAWKRAWDSVKPLIGTQRLDKFGCKQVAQVRSALKKKLGTRSIQMCWQVMALAFDVAFRRSMYFRANPWRIERAPKHETKEVRILRDAEVPRFLAAAAMDRFEALWLLALFCGLRVGECLGLPWAAIDWESGEIHVRQQLTEVDGVMAIGKPKTTESIRTVYADAIVLEALRRRRKVALKEGHRSQFVFTANTGHFISRSNLRQRHFNKICQKAEITGLTIHSLRHKYTVEGVDAGQPVTAVAQSLGHRSTRMVLNRYGWHPQEHQQRAVAQAVTERLTGVTNRTTGT